MKIRNQVLLFAFLSAGYLTACSKSDFGRDFTLFPGPAAGTLPVSYKIMLHRVNVYPSGGKLQIDPYVSSDSTNFSKTPGTIAFALPAVDSAFTQSGSPNKFYYLKWKVTGPGNDSLSGGNTPILRMTSYAIFGILY